MTNDGALSKTSTVNGFLVMYYRDDDSPHLVYYHCIIHQQVPPIRFCLTDDHLDSSARADNRKLSHLLQPTNAAASTPTTSTSCQNPQAPEALKNTSQKLTSSMCLTLTFNNIFVSTNSMNFVFPSRTPTC
ncbi:hypothetical protein TNCV_2744631 [Trichonephila clavipes]|nr:hypothetical protein TNCV_2744631 [Trichonephila clavipes]